MDLKCYIFVAISFSVISAQMNAVYRPPCSPFPPRAYISNLATPIPTVIETIDYITTKPCVRNFKCNDQLILPPLAAELPYGLGYFPSALPIVAKSFEPTLEYMNTACIPVTSPCDCLTLAAPMCFDWSALAKPIIL